MTTEQREAVEALQTANSWRVTKGEHYIVLPLIHAARLHGLIAEQAAEIERLKAARAWRPIAEAPKNMPIVARHRLWKSPAVVFGDGPNWWLANDGTYCGIPPSHFFDIPESPTESTHA